MWVFLTTDELFAVESALVGIDDEYGLVVGRYHSYPQNETEVQENLKAFKAGDDLLTKIHLLTGSV